MDQIIKEVKAEGEEVDLRLLARDGRRITQTIIGMGGYQSVAGNFIRMDASGNPVGNFTAFAVKKQNYTSTSRFQSP